MATINISNLSPAGAELFGDSESYLNDLTNEELNATGGIKITTTTVFTMPWTPPLWPTIPPRRW